MFVVVVVGVVILVVNLDKIIPNGGGEEDTRVIEYGDSAILEFKMWVDTDGDGDVDWDEFHDSNGDEITPAMGGTTYPTILDNVEPRGFYSRMIGMKQGSIDSFELEANVDADQDYIDDNTGDPTVSYGKPSSQYYNTAIRYYIKILNITKEGEDPLPFNTVPSASSSSSLDESLFGVNDLLYCANSLLVKKCD